MLAPFMMAPLTTPPSNRLDHVERLQRQHEGCQLSPILIMRLLGHRGRGRYRNRGRIFVGFIDTDTDTDPDADGPISKMRIATLRANASKFLPLLQKKNTFCKNRNYWVSPSLWRRVCSRCRDRTSRRGRMAPLVLVLVLVLGSSRLHALETGGPVLSRHSGQGRPGSICDRGRRRGRER